MNKRKIYRLLDNDKVVVNNFLLEVLADRGVEAINDWFPNYNGDERLTIIPIKPTTEWKPYLKGRELTKELDQFLISKNRKHTKEVVYLEQGKDWLNRLVFFLFAVYILKKTQNGAGAFFNKQGCNYRNDIIK